MRHVQVEATGGWGLGGSPEGDRRGLSLAGAPWDRSAARRKVSVVLELSRGSDLDSVSRRHGLTVAKLSAWWDAILAGGDARFEEA